jgi:hypothetical protein
MFSGNEKSQLLYPIQPSHIYSWDHSGFFFSAKAFIPKNESTISKPSSNSLRDQLTNLLILAPKQRMEKPPLILHPLLKR